MITGYVRLARRDFGLGLFDQCFLQTFLLFDIFDSSLSGGDISLSLIKLSAVVVIHDPIWGVLGSKSHLISTTQHIVEEC
jgi:hypothetical protein